MEPNTENREDLRTEFYKRPHGGPAGVPSTPPEGATKPNDYDFVVRVAGLNSTTVENLQSPDEAGTPDLASFGHYESLKFVARGGMGIVYKARDVKLDRVVALKLMRDGAFASATAIARFQNEAKAVAKLKHPNIVTVYEVGETLGQHYFSMAYVAGGSLARERNAFCPPEELSSQSSSDGSRPSSQTEARERQRRVAGLMEKVARGVQHAHEHGVLHRDLKPGNILLDETGEPLVSDFGLAKHLDSPVDLTQAGAFLGTPAYMAPEQAGVDGLSVGPRTDVWAMGVVLYELLTGKRPFDAATRELVLGQVRTMEPPRPRALRREMDASLEAIVLKCLEKDPARRYASAAALADDLGRWQRGEPTEARPIPQLRRLARWVAKRPWQTATAGLLTVLAGIMLGAALFPSSPVAPSATVHIVTDPPGARVVLVPQDEFGDLHDKDAIRPEGDQRTPLTLKNVPPGKYLVVVELPDHRFQEVYRSVPGPGMTRGQRLFQSWKPLADGSFELPEIKIPRSDTPEFALMGPFDGGKFKMGMSDAPAGNPFVDIVTPVHDETVEPFRLDASEVTVGDYEKVMGNLPDALRASHNPIPADFKSYAVTHVTFFQAMEYAERVGKRLMTEAEYEFACGRLQWKKQPVPAPKFDWTPGPVASQLWDRTDTNPPVFGLYSNAVEWTDSHLISYRPDAHPRLLMRHVDPTNVLSFFVTARTVRGGPVGAARQTPADPAEVALGVHFRFMVQAEEALPGLGFRCARSDKPRFLDPSPPVKE